MDSAPFYVSAEGWGEFPLHIEIIPKKGLPIKVTHYLKLNAPDRIVVNETFEYVPTKLHASLDSIPSLLALETPVMAEYFLKHNPIDYVSLEEAFLSANAHLLGNHRVSVEELSRQALQKTEDVIALQFKLSETRTSTVN